MHIRLTLNRRHTDHYVQLVQYDCLDSDNSNPLPYLRIWENGVPSATRIRSKWRPVKLEYVAANRAVVVAAQVALGDVRLASRTDRSTNDLTPETTMPAASEVVEHVRTRRQISHDIHHELGTIMLLATLLTDADDVGSESRRRARLILGETRWLEQLLRAYDDTSDHGEPSWHDAHSAIPVDEVLFEVVEAMRTATLATIRLASESVCVRVSRLTLWRALRNILDNAIRAAGPSGAVDVRAWADSGWILIEIDDDGPGFGAGGNGRSSLGLNIVQDFVADAGGQLEIRRGFLGGCCVSLRLPEVAEGAPQSRADIS